MQQQKTPLQIAIAERTITVAKIWAAGAEIFGGAFPSLSVVQKVVAGTYVAAEAKHYDMIAQAINHAAQAIAKAHIDAQSITPKHLQAIKLF